MKQSTARPSAAGSRVSTGADETQEIGRRIGALAPAATVLALIGPLGAGKTQLAKGVARGLGITGVVDSPTYILMNEHAGRLRMYHIDAYRLEDPEDAVAAGLLDDRQADGITVVEWADRLEGWLPDERLEIHLRSGHGGPEHRELRWRATGASHARLANDSFGAP